MEWFDVQMLTNAPKERVNTRKGCGASRLKLRRVSRKPPRIEQVSVLSTETVNTIHNQLRPVITNALMAAYTAKLLLEAEFGPGALGLGTTGVERGWWQSHLRNLNRTGIWATRPTMQYRAVTSWKTELRAALTRITTCIQGTSMTYAFLFPLYQ
jgi:hypothetical protein